MDALVYRYTYTPIHTALGAFPVAGVRLSFITRRASRRVASAAPTVAVVLGLSQHSGMRGIRV